MNAHTENATAAGTRKRKPADKLTNLFPPKGAARHSPATSDESPPPVVSAPQAPAVNKTRRVGVKNDAGGGNLATMLLALNSVEAEVAPEFKSSVNVKLKQDTERKLKVIVGIEKARRMTNFSQQDWLESRLELLINFEYRNLPKLS